jgi:hypothetical protein
VSRWRSLVARVSNAIAFSYSAKSVGGYCKIAHADQDVGVISSSKLRTLSKHHLEALQCLFMPHFPAEHLCKIARASQNKPFSTAQKSVLPEQLLRLALLLCCCIHSSKVSHDFEGTAELHAKLFAKILKYLLIHLFYFSASALIAQQSD